MAFPLFVAGSTKCEIIFDSVCEGLFEIVNGCALDGDDISCVDDLAVEYTGIFIDFNIGLKPFVVHGWSPSGLIPASAGNRLIESDRKSTRLNSSHIPLSR